MKIRQLLILSILFFTKPLLSQKITESLEQAIRVFNKDLQMENGIIGFYAINANTGKPVYAKNEDIGLATASCLKVITSATAFELLGADFQFSTSIGYTGTLENGVLKGSLVIYGSGDPTLGSWRWEQTKTVAVINKMVELIQMKGIKTVTGKLIFSDGNTKNITPGNWIWEDLGNYYGAPVRLFNWRENQFDLHFATGKDQNNQPAIIKIDPDLPNTVIYNETGTGAVGSGDQSVIYLPPFGTKGVIKGTIPAQENDFVVSGATPDPTNVFAKTFLKKLKDVNIKIPEGLIRTIDKQWNKKEQSKTVLIGKIESPTLDKINYWFLKKSINLYGEAFLNTIGGLNNSNEKFETKKGVAEVQNFWENKGIPIPSLNIYDGSGLSPSNRVTAKTLVKIMAYAQDKPWFNSYLDAFPVYNEMKLKSGTINDVKGFSGYHTAKDGTKYIVAFLVNNYNGASKTLVNKMYKVLDVLK